jgi:predicted nucleotide-binding protein
MKVSIMTPDDIGYAKKDGESKAEPRARQNVVLEMGMLISSLSRPNVAILKRGHLEVPSDANGILYIGFNEHVKETVPRLAERLNHAGFKIDAQAIARAAA